MKQLGSLDSAFINLERRNTPQHIGGLGIYDPSTAAEGFVRFKEVLANFEHRLKKEPLFRTRLVEVPGDIDRPYWVEDGSFDVEYHIRHISLPKPGDWRQLWIQVARLHSRPLDMTRPLWEVYVIEGLDNVAEVPKGAFAMYTKMHHSMVDGVGGDSLVVALHDLEPTPAAETSAPSTIVVDRQPSDTELFVRSCANLTMGTYKNVRTASNTVSDLVRYGLSVARDEIPSPDIQAPRTRFNRKVGPHRVVEAVALPLADFKAIKSAAEVTVNDVALSVIGGAMRQYLELHNELPDEALVASIPMNMRSRRAGTAENNQVGSTFCEIHTHIADPLERLHAVRQSTKIAKQASDGNPMLETMRLAGFLSPAISKSIASFWANQHLSQYLPMNTSTVVTNVPGPNFPIYCAGAQLTRYHGLGLLTPGCGLFHTVLSNNGVLTITALADRKVMPDPERYRQCLRDSFEETRTAVLGRRLLFSDRFVRANGGKYSHCV